MSKTSQNLWSLQFVKNRRVSSFNEILSKTNLSDLRTSVKDHNLSYRATDQMTYKGHNSSQSQIDYMFSQMIQAW